MSLDIWLTTTVDVGGPEPETVTFIDKNITHNLSGMWRHIGVYDALPWLQEMVEGCRRYPKAIVGVSA